MFVRQFISRFLLALLCSLLSQAAIAAEPPEKRVALVIGNSSYKNSPLKNPVNDAHDMAVRLKALGFEVIERSNLRTRQMGATLREFRSKLTPGAVALVFYAGHGVQIKGENYLPSVDAEIESEEDIPSQAISMRQVMDVLEESKSRLNLVFLDACRNNPYARSFRSGSDGLARVSAPSGTLISYATRPGSVAADGSGKNGLYTGHLLKQMEQANQPVEQVLKRVVTAVKNESGGKQEPWMEGSIEGDFCFGNCGQGLASQSPARTRSAMEIEDELWAGIKDSGSRAAFNEYLSQYPKGKYATQAAALARAPVANEGLELAAWTRADQSRSVKDYESYLAAYPSGRFAALASGRVATVRAQAEDEAAWSQLGPAPVRGSLQAYLSRFPQGSHADAARQQLRATQAAVVRPTLPVALDESVWAALEASDAFQKFPPIKPFRVNAEVFAELVEGPKKVGSEIVKTESHRALQAAPGWVEMRNNISDQAFIKTAFGGMKPYYTTEEQSTVYSAFGGLLPLVVFNPKGMSYNVTAIERIEGNLFPLKEGARLKIEGRLSLAGGKAPFAISREVGARVDASTLSSKLTGGAWPIRRAESDKPLPGTPAEDDYYLEDLGVMLSLLTVKLLPNKIVMMPAVGTRHAWMVKDPLEQILVVRKLDLIPEN